MSIFHVFSTLFGHTSSNHRALYVFGTELQPVLCLFTPLLCHLICLHVILSNFRADNVSFSESSEARHILNIADRSGKKAERRRKLGLRPHDRSHPLPSGPVLCPVAAQVLSSRGRGSSSVGFCVLDGGAWM